MNGLNRIDKSIGHVRKIYPYDPRFVKTYKIAAFVCPCIGLLFFIVACLDFYHHGWFLLKWLLGFYFLFDLIILIKNDIRYYSLGAIFCFLNMVIFAIFYAFLYMYNLLYENNQRLLMIFFIAYFLLVARQFFIPDFKNIKEKFFKTQHYLGEGIILRQTKREAFVWYRGSRAQKILQVVWDIVCLFICSTIIYTAYQTQKTHDTNDPISITVISLLIGILFTQFIAIMIYQDYLTWKATRHIKKRFIWGTTG